MSKTYFSVPVAVANEHKVLRKLFLAALILCWFLTIVSYYEHYPFRQGILTVSLLFTCGLISMDELLMYRKDYINMLGTLRLTETEITVVLNDVPRTFTYDEISRLVLNINETGRDKRIRSSFNKRKSGLRNSIEIIELNQDSWTYPLYIDSAREIEQLDDFLKAFRSKKIVVKREGETVGSIKETHYKWYPKKYWDTSPKKNP